MASWNPRSPRLQAAAASTISDRFGAVRARSLDISSRLSPEDHQPQSMPDASPLKWHLGHVTWFFEVFVLQRNPAYQPFNPRYGFIFNSYYETLGPRQPRPERGLLTRPALTEVLSYRAHVDEAVQRALAAGSVDPDGLEALELGLHHEQQHQELMLTDILHLLAQNPLEPAFDAALARASQAAEPPGPVVFLERDGGLVSIGAGEGGFAFDNERPRHETLLRPHALADRLVTAGEVLEFIEDGGYDRPEFWLSDGWSRRLAEGWSAPLYWRREASGWTSFSLAGRRALDLEAPAVHLSFYEADAFARWRGARLPTEAEWESAAASQPIEGNLYEAGRLMPAASPGEGLRQLYGDCWEWTSSPYSPFPGFAPAAGAVGEYNGKFMINQMVLKGGSCVTPSDHVRASYRNFFHPHQRWQFTGLRLARDLPPAGPRPRSGDEAFRRDVLLGLSQSPKAIPSKYFYDARGSDLFEAICALDAYYPTRVETALLRDIAGTLAETFPPGAALVEYGSGASLKTRILLDAAPTLAGYVPIDISPSALEAAAEAITAAYPALTVLPVVADFSKPLPTPSALEGRPLIGFFPGSTIGNLTRADAERFLRQCGETLGEGAQMIIGVDLVKDEAVLRLAYNDPEGVTAAFNKNLLVRINRDLGADFDVDAFTHIALWNAEAARIEMHLEALRDMDVRVGGWSFHLGAGERIHTENSHKYRPSDFEDLARAAGWGVCEMWAAPPPAFAVFSLGAFSGTPASGGPAGAQSA